MSYSRSSQLAKSVECPVCFLVPRTVPVPCCPVGHVICTTCRGKMDSCPICRREFGDNVSSVAADIIHLLELECKNVEKGCQVRLCHYYTLLFYYS
jgi:E3 ubiquitin-protein ligase SIAH1